MVTIPNSSNIRLIDIISESSFPVLDPQCFDRVPYLKKPNPHDARKTPNNHPFCIHCVPALAVTNAVTSCPFHLHLHLHHSPLSLHFLPPSLPQIFYYIYSFLLYFILNIHRLPLTTPQKVPQITSNVSPNVGLFSRSFFSCSSSTAETTAACFFEEVVCVLRRERVDAWELRRCGCGCGCRFGCGCGWVDG